jgi:flagellar biosynthesis protein
VALQYGVNDKAPVVVASGMGYLAERIVEVASENGVPIYEDNSLATVLTQLQLGQEIPEELYRAIVEIYVYFLHFDPNAREQAPPPAQKQTAAPEPAETPEAQAPPPTDPEQNDREKERE